MRLVSLLILLFSCTHVARSPAADDPPVDIKVDVVAWTKEYEEDKKAFAQKYKGKIVEVTGKVFKVGDITDNVLMEGYKKPSDLLGVLASATPTKEERAKFQGLRSLSKNQTLTVRGKCFSGTAGILDCTFVKVGPNTAMPYTIASLTKAHANEATRKKLLHTDVVVRAQIVDVKATDVLVRWTLTDPGKKGGPKVSAQITTNDKRLLDEYGKTKAGDVVIVLGEIDSEDQCSLWDARLLKEPPEGVKLPGDKK